MILKDLVDMVELNMPLVCETARALTLKSVNSGNAVNINLIIDILEAIFKTDNIIKLKETRYERRKL
jgi:hypothetical protein